MSEIRPRDWLSRADWMTLDLLAHARPHDISTRVLTECLACALGFTLVDRQHDQYTNASLQVLRAHGLAETDLLHRITSHGLRTLVSTTGVHVASCIADDPTETLMDRAESLARKRSHWAVSR